MSAILGQINPNVPSGAQIPDTYVYISTAPTSIGTTQPKDEFIVATGILGGSQITSAPYSLTAGNATPNEIVQYSDVTRVNQKFNRRSPIANRFRSALQEVPIGINIFLASIAEPSNTLFAGFATKILTFIGTASGSGEILLRVCGNDCFVPVASGDTAAIMAADAKTALDAKILDAPMVTAALISTTTVPLTYVVRGVDGNDSPILISIPPEITGVSISPGTITVATTSLGAAAAASLMTLQCDSTVYVTSIPVGTTAANAAILIAATINATTGPLAATVLGAVVTLIFRSGWYVKKLQMSSTEDAAGQTYTLADRHDSAGAITTVATIAGSPALTGLTGAGAPVLTTLLDNKAKAAPMIEWSVDYLDSTSVNAVTKHIDTYSNGYYQRNERVTWVSTDPLETAKLVLTSATPQLQNYWRTAVGVYQGAPCQGGAYAAAIAARLCATDLPYNMDGLQLATGTLAPMLPGRAETDLSPTSQDVALGSYHLFPLVGINGVVTLIRGKTTWGQSNTEWGDFSYGRMFDQFRFGWRSFLNTRFAGKVLFSGGGTVRVPNAYTLVDVVNATGEYLDSQDGIIVDGAKSLKQFIAAEIDKNDRSFIRLFARERPPREGHVRSAVLAAAA